MKPKLPHQALFKALLLWMLLSHVNSIQLSTSTRLPGVSSSKAHTFLSTPSNWPKIVASSFSVQPVRGNSYSQTDTSMVVGDVVDEIFGLPPLLPLNVRWTCERSNSSAGDLEFFSADGLPNVAKDCRMIFAIRDEEEMDPKEGCVVDFTMQYEALSPIASFAMPLLEIDNNVAIRVLLPMWCK